MKQKLYAAASVVGGVLLLVGACTFITGWGLSPYLYTLGAIGFAIPQLMDRYEGPNIVIRRLRRQQMLGALALLLTSYFMFTGRHNEWVLCLAVAAVLELYTVFRISSEEAKDQKK